MYITHNDSEVKKQSRFDYLKNIMKYLQSRTRNAKVIKYKEEKKDSFDNSL